MTAVSSSVAWLASWNSPSPSMSTGISPLKHQNRRGIGLSRRRRRSPCCTGPGRRSPVPRRTGRSRGHSRPPCRRRRPHGRRRSAQFRLACQRRQERIDQPAGHHEKVCEPFLHQSIQNEVGTQCHGHLSIYSFEHAATDLKLIPALVDLDGDHGLLVAHQAAEEISQNF